MNYRVTGCKLLVQVKINYAGHLLIRVKKLQVLRTNYWSGRRPYTRRPCTYRLVIIIPVQVYAQIHRVSMPQELGENKGLWVARNTTGTDSQRKIL